MENENNIVYDAEEELKESIKENSNDEEEVLYEAPDPAKIKKENEEKRKIEKELEKIPEKTVFTDGIKPEFVLSHKCPHCYSSKKDVRELTIRPYRLSLKRKIIGYISTCANCGGISFYSTNPDEFLAYLRGRALKDSKESFMKRMKRKINNRRKK